MKTEHDNNLYHPVLLFETEILLCVTYKQYARHTNNIDAGTEGAFRMTDTRPGATPASESGILEVFHAGAWGTLCNGDFGILEVCSSPQAQYMDAPHP